MSDIFQVPATIEKIETMANGLRLRIDTQENLSPEAIHRLMGLYNKLGWFTFNVHLIEAEDLVNLPPLKKSGVDVKTPSQRLRSVFYRMWQQNSMGYASSDDHYAYMMEKLIDFYKDKLE